MKNILIFLLSLSFSALSSQCFPDRHNTNITDSWVSCNKSANPNPANGNSYWLMYDLGASYDLYNVHLWNINHPDFVTYGFKKMKIEYSADATSWSTLGTFTIPKALSSSYYEGYRGVNFEGLNARYVLVTGVENYGGSCFGLAEIKIYTSPQELDDWEFAVTVCESDGVISQLSFGEDLNGAYTGAGVTDNNDGSFDFNADLLGPGNYDIQYEYQDAGVTKISQGTIEVLSCESRFCGDCLPCGGFSQLAIDSDPIPEGIYAADSVSSIGNVNAISQNVNFRGEDFVSLGPGFKSQPSDIFVAEIRDCQTNLVQNPSFEGSLNPWSSSFSSTTPGSASTVSSNYFEASNAALIDVFTSAPNDPWRVKFQQTGITLEEGKKYELSFAIKGDVRKEAQIRCNTATVFVSETIDVDPFWNHHTFLFTADNNISNCVINFQLGATQGSTYIDHVRLVKID